MVKDDDFVRVTFIPVMPEETALTAYIADVNNRMVHRRSGADLTGIPKRKYRITVSHERN